MKIGALVFNGVRRDCGLTSAELKVERGKSFGLPFGVSAPPWSSPCYFDFAAVSSLLLFGILKRFKSSSGSNHYTMELTKQNLSK
jgi:hypothetical protein